MTARRRRRRREEGFLLLETLVAVVLMSLLMMVLPGGIVVSRRMVEKSLSTVSAGLVAEAVLAGELAPGTLQFGTRSGIVDGYEWMAHVRPRAGLVPSRRDEGERQAQRQADWTPYDVTVEVRAPDGTTIAVDTLRIGSARQ